MKPSYEARIDSRHSVSGCPLSKAMSNIIDLHDKYQIHSVY